MEVHLIGSLCLCIDLWQNELFIIFEYIGYSTLKNLGKDGINFILHITIILKRAVFNIIAEIALCTFM